MVRPGRVVAEGDPLFWPDPIRTQSKKGQQSYDEALHACFLLCLHQCPYLEYVPASNAWRSISIASVPSKLKRSAMFSFYDRSTVASGNLQGTVAQVLG